MGGAGGDVVAEEDLFGRPPTHHRPQRRQGPSARHERALGRGEVGHASRLTAGDDRHFVGPVGVGLDVSADGVTRLVIGDDAAIALGGHGGATLQAQHDAVEGRLQVVVGDLVGCARTPLPVDEALEIDPENPTVRAASDDVDAGGGYVLEMDLEDPLASGPVGQPHGCDANRRSRAGSSTSERLVAAMTTIGCRLLRKPSISVRSWRALPLFVAVPDGGAATPPPRVALVDEDHRRCRLGGPLEQVAHALGPDPDEHLHELRGRDGEERNLRLGGGGAGQRGLPGPGGPFEQHPARGFGAQALEPLRIRQEVDDFRHLDDRLVETAQALEPEVGDVRRPGGASRDRHPARTGPGDDEPGDEGEQRQRHQGGGDVGRRRLRRLHPEVRGVDPQLSQERLLGGLEVPVAVGEGALFVVAGPPHRPGVGADVHLFHGAAGQGGHELGLGERHGSLPRGEDGDYRDDHDPGGDDQEPGAAAQERHEATEPGLTHGGPSPSGTVCRRRWWWTCWELGLL